MNSYESKIHYWQDVTYNGKRSPGLLWIRMPQMIIKVITQKDIWWQEPEQILDHLPQQRSKIVRIF
jgi:hypothetical protein